MVVKDANIDLGDVVADIANPLQLSYDDLDPDLVKLQKGALSHHKIIASYLELLIEKLGIRKHYLVDSNPYFTVLVQNPANPAPVDVEAMLHDELADKRKLFRYQYDVMRFVTNCGTDKSPVFKTVESPMFKITRLNAELLEEVLKQELLDDSEATHDPRVYILLPHIIKYHLHRFNSELKQHILQSMAHHLNTNDDSWAYQQKPNPNMHFSHQFACDFPAIFVSVDGGPAVDLMQMLATDISKFSREDFKRIQPASAPKDTLMMRARRVHETETTYQTPRPGFRTPEGA